MEQKIKTVLLTGCSSGIGYETALLFAHQGYTVLASVRNLSAPTVKELTKHNIEVLKIDVTNETDIKNSVKEIIKKTGRIDILVNNAGYGTLGPVEEHSLEEIKAQYDTNVLGMIRMIKAVMPVMRTQQKGTIINLSSINGLMAFPLWGIYSSSKYAVESLTQSLRVEAAHFGIKVSLVEPGAFFTSFARNKKNPAAMSHVNSPYKGINERFFKRYEKGATSKHPFIIKLTDPKKVAQLILKIAQSDNPELRYRIGIDAHLYYILDRILPWFTKEFMLRKFYRW